MKLNLILTQKPISINKAYYNNRKVLTKEARDLRDHVFHKLIEQQSEVLAFKEYAESKLKEGYGLCVSFKVMVPIDLYYTQKGDLSRRGGDLDNYFKILLDFTLNPKYGHEKAYNTFNNLSVQNIGVDDQNIVHITAIKAPLNQIDWEVHMTVGIVPINSLESLLEAQDLLNVQD